METISTARSNPFLLMTRPTNNILRGEPIFLSTSKLISAGMISCGKAADKGSISTLSFSTPYSLTRLFCSHSLTEMMVEVLFKALFSSQTERAKGNFPYSGQLSSCPMKVVSKYQMEGTLVLLKIKND